MTFVSVIIAIAHVKLLLYIHTIKKKLIAMVRTFHIRIGKYVITLDVDLDRLNLVSLFYIFH